MANGEIMGRRPPNMNSSPLVSVVLTTWAPDAYRMGLLKQTVSTLQKHWHDDACLIVVDNGPENQTEYIRSIVPDYHIIPRWNVNNGRGKNLGARLTESQYIAWIDNDISFNGPWLESSIELLWSRRDLIACPVFSQPMQVQRNFDCEENGIKLYFRASGCCQVMSRVTYQDIGPWGHYTRHDGPYSNQAVTLGYRYALVPGELATHCGERRSYNVKHHVIDGKWTSDAPVGIQRLRKAKGRA